MAVRGPVATVDGMRMLDTRFLVELERQRLLEAMAGFKRASEPQALKFSKTGRCRTWLLPMPFKQSENRP